MTQTVPTCAYIADERDLSVPSVDQRIITDVDEAADRISAALVDRITSILAVHPGHVPTVMLGGGVDSAAVALTLFEQGIDFETVTCFSSGHTGDLAAASAISLTLGVDNYPLMLEPFTTPHYAKRAIESLGTAELWEVSAAMYLLMLRDQIDEWEKTSPSVPRVFLDGGGADTLFLGDEVLPYPIGTDDARTWIDERVRALASAYFIWDRLTPDFYSRLLGEHAERFFLTYQCDQLWDVAASLDSPAMYRGPSPRSTAVGAPGATVDKYAIRTLVSRYEPLRWVASAPKSPLQRSSGIQSAIFEAATWEARALPDALIYRDPLRDSGESIAARLWLEQVRQDRTTIPTGPRA